MSIASHGRILDLDKVPDFHTGAEMRVRSDVTERPDLNIFVKNRVIDLSGVYNTPVSDR